MIVNRCLLEDCVAHALREVRARARKQTCGVVRLYGDVLRYRVRAPHLHQSGYIHQQHQREEYVRVHLSSSELFCATCTQLLVNVARCTVATCCKGQRMLGYR